MKDISQVTTSQTDLLVAVVEKRSARKRGGHLDDCHLVSVVCHSDLGIDFVCSE
jgi:hypothetical protein